MLDVSQVIPVDIWSIVKIFVLFGFSIYLVFAFVVVRQIQLMTQTLEVGYENIIRLLGIIHLLFAIAVFLLAFLIL